MGLIDPMAINSAVFSGIIPLGSSLGLWASLVSVLTVAAFGIGMAVARPPRARVALRHLQPATVH
jgi:hypothetical protein